MAIFIAGYGHAAWRQHTPVAGVRQNDSVEVVDPFVAQIGRNKLVRVAQTWRTPIVAREF